MESFIGNNDEYRYPPESVCEKVDVIDVFDDIFYPDDSDSLAPKCTSADNNSAIVLATDNWAI